MTFEELEQAYNEAIDQNNELEDRISEDRTEIRRLTQEKEDMEIQMNKYWNALDDIRASIDKELR